MNFFPAAIPPVVFATWHNPIVQYVDGGDVVDGRPNPVRAHQRNALQAARNLLQNSNHVQLVLPTGSGKTGIIVLLPYYLQKLRVVVIAPKPDIALQISEQFTGPLFDDGNYPPRSKDAFFFKVGIDPREDVRTSMNGRMSVVPSHSFVTKSEMAPEHFHDPLLIFNVQRIRQAYTTTQIRQLPRDVNLVVVDEAHHYPAGMWINLINHYQNTKILFLTATPNPMSNFPTWTYTFAQAVTDGVIRDIEFDECPASNDAIGDIIRRLKQIVNRHDNVQHNRFYQAMIKTGNVEKATEILTRYNLGIQDPRERAYMFVEDTDPGVKAAFLSGGFRTMIVCHRLIEGFDHPKVAFVAVTSSMGTTTFEQFVGRATRIDDGHVRTATIVTHLSLAQRQNYLSMRGGNWALPEDDDDQ